MDLLDSISTLIFIILIVLRTLAYVTITGNHHDNNHTGSLLMQKTEQDLYDKIHHLKLVYPFNQT